MRDRNRGADRPFGYRLERRPPVPHATALDPAPQGEPVLVTTLIRRAHGLSAKVAGGASSESGAGWRRADRSPRHGAAFRTILVRSASIGALVSALLVGGGLSWNLVRESDAAVDERALVSTAVAPDPSPINPLSMGPISTGVPFVDDALRGFLSGDIEAALATLLVREVPCGVPPWGGVPVLACAKGEAPGAVHEVILSGCEPGWISPEAARAELTSLLAVTPGVYSVARSGRDYVTMLAWPEAPDASLNLVVSSLGITSYAAGCEVPVAAPPGYALKFASGQSR